MPTSAIEAQKIVSSQSQWHQLYNQLL